MVPLEPELRVWDLPELETPLEQGLWDASCPALRSSGGRECRADHRLSEAAGFGAATFKVAEISQPFPLSSKK